MHYLCHYCQKNAYNQLFVKCCKKKCSKIFCQECILLKFDKCFKHENVKAETWICYSCGDKCDCIQCDPRGLKRKNPSSLTQKKSLRLRVSGKTKWYHEKHRGPLNTIALDGEKNHASSSFLNTKEEREEGSGCEEEKKLKRKPKKDLAKLEDTYLKRKKAVRVSFEEEEITQNIEDKEAKINQILSEIDLGGAEFEIIEETKE